MSISIKVKSKSFIKTVKEIMAEPQFLTRVISTIGLKDHVLVRQEMTYQVDSDMVAVSAVLKKIQDGRLEKMTVLFRKGAPTLRQMRELTYTLGADAEYKVALFNETVTPGLNYEHLDCGCYNCAKSFIEALNTQGVPTYLVRVGDNEEFDGLNFDELELCKGYDGNKVDSNAVKLTREDFERNELWIVHYPRPFFEACDVNKRAADWSVDPADEINVLDKATSSLRWDQSGQYVIWQSSDEVGRKAMKWIINNRKAFIEELYGTQEIERKYSIEKEVITIKVGNTPYRNFVLAGDAEKRSMMEAFVDWQYRSENSLEDMLEEYCELSEKVLEERPVSNRHDGENCGDSTPIQTS